MAKQPPDTFSPIAFDTLKVYEDLQEAGLGQEAARAVVEAMARAHANRGARVADLREVEHRLDLRLLELDRKLELQEARNRVGISTIRKEGDDIRKSITQGLARLTWIIVILFALAVVLVPVSPHLPGFPWGTGGGGQEVTLPGIGLQGILPAF